ncbi:condensation domain-containing protein [Phytohabitans kaempferiae]|uniref:Condensation domain-containing protein n=1 Tax=Phytohabitans kaempferiae TaxID=1620943 RepID=A0ABV6LW75_9ACTN
MTDTDRVEKAAAAAGQPDAALDAEIAELERQVAERLELERRLAERADAERRLAEKRAAKERLTPARPVAPPRRDGSFVCTYQQERAWLAAGVHHLPLALRLHGELVVPALARASHALVVRHEALRTCFVERDGRLRQVIDPPPAIWPLPVPDLPAGQVGAWAAEEIRRPMDLATGPPLRTALARVAPDEHVLLLVVHEIVADEWSVHILANELSHLYAAATSGIPPKLPDLPSQPAEHAAWQRDWLAGPEPERQLDYWRRQLAELPTVDLPADRPRPARPTGAGATLRRRLPDDLAAAARACAAANRVSLLALAQAALLTVLHRYTGQRDLPVGSVFSGRGRAEVDPLVGSFVNPVVLRTSLDGEPGFAELARRCHDTVRQATAHQEIPFGRVLEAVRPGGPPFRISLSLLPVNGGGGRTALGDLAAEPVDAGTGHSGCDIAIDLDDLTEGELHLSVRYAAELFDANRIERLVDHLTAALTGGLTGWR